MRTSRLMTISAALALVATLDLPASFAEPTIYSNAIYQKGDCMLVVEDAHISKSLLKNKKPVMAVKANVSSNCIYAQQKVIFQIWLYKQIGENKVLVEKFQRTVNSPKPSPFKVEIKDAWVTCKNTQRTKYIVQARSWTFIAGKEYASLVGRSLNDVVLPCGV